MVNPVISSTRSGGPIAAAWATLRHIGDAGYLALAERTLDAVRALSSAVSVIDGLRLLPGDSTVVSFTSDDPSLDLFVLADELAERGWHTQPQFRHGAIPRSIHLTVTAAVLPQVGSFASDLPSAVAAARSSGPAAAPDGVVEMLGSLSPEMLTSELVGSLAAGLGLLPVGGPGGGLASGSPPARMASVNALLDAAPPLMRERLLVAFLSLLQRPAW